MINGHGDDLHNFEGDIHYNFSSNVYYKGCNSKLLHHLEKNIPQIQNYPSPIAEELNVLAATRFGLNSNQFLFGNGATELFYLIAQCFREKKAVIVGPTFAEYEDACKMHKVDITFMTRDAVLEEAFDAAVIFICNPNNPDGKIMSTDQIASLLKANPNTHFIIDEAYNEFTNSVSSAMSLIGEFTNLTIVRSLTKTFAIPGLRLGYVVSNPTFIKQLLTFKLPWTVNSLAIASGEYIFENYQALCFNLEVLLEETNAFKRELHALNGFSVMEGETTYFLLSVGKGTATALKNHLANTHGILVRDATNFTGLKGEFIRVSIQKREANNALINALKLWN